jgi:hypothetical protein
MMKIYFETMKKQYTTEEIITRLKTHETFVAIKMLLGDLIRYISVGNQYACRDVGLSTFTIIDDLKYKRQFDISDFNTYFMFTSDYESMKSEEKGDNETLHPLTETKQEIPEWLQRERVRFWGNSFREYKAEDAISMANEDLKEFDKQFLNQKDTK